MERSTPATAPMTIPAMAPGLSLAPETAPVAVALEADGAEEEASRGGSVVVHVLAQSSPFTNAAICALLSLSGRSVVMTSFSTPKVASGPGAWERNDVVVSLS